MATQTVEDVPRAGSLPQDQPLVDSSQVDTPVETPTPEPKPSSTTMSMLQIATAMTCLCACVFVSALDVTIVTTALPTIVADFASSSSSSPSSAQSGYTWIGTAFTLAHTASTPSWGKLSDIWGRRPMLLGANAFFLAGSLACALVRDMGGLIAGRAIQGLGAGGMATIVNICIGDMFSQRDRGLYYGLTSVMWALASGVGPVVGGVFTSKLTWRWCFWINVPITGAVFPLLYFSLRLPDPKTPLRAGLGAIDWTGSALIVGGAVMLLLGLDFGGTHHPWHSPTVICLITFGLVTAGLFAVNEWKLATHPIIPLRLFKTTSSAAAYGVCFFHAFAFLGVAYYLPLYFQSVLLASPLMSGVYLLPLIVSSSISAALIGWYIQWSGKYRPAVLLGAALTTLGIGLLVNLDVDANWVKLSIYQLIAGIGFGMNLEGPMLAVQVAVPGRDIGTATATMGFLRTMATAVSIVIGGVVFQNEMSGKKTWLVDMLGPDTAALLDGSRAAASVDIVKGLPATEQRIARQAFYEATRSMWIMFVAFSGVTLLLSFLIEGHDLKTEHEVTEVGLGNVARQEVSGSNAAVDEPGR